MAVSIDYTQEETLCQIFPQSPQSFVSLAQHAYLGCHRQPAHETPDYITEQHVISILLSDALVVEQWWEDSYHTKNYLVQGDVSIYPANRVQKLHWDGNFAFLDLYFDPILIKQTAQEFGLDSVEVFPCPVVQDPLLKQMGLALKAEFESGLLDRTINRLYVESLIHTLMIYLLKNRHQILPRQQENSRGLSASTLKTAISFIKENLANDLSLTEISASVYMSSHYFATLFKEATGQTPHQYVIACRLEEAKKLLAQKELTISDICKRTGFQCPSHFTKVFRRYTKITPKAYRDRL
jgi:AraC family transcriptional regulator